MRRRSLCQQCAEERPPPTHLTLSLSLSLSLTLTLSLSLSLTLTLTERQAAARQARDARRRRGAYEDSAVGGGVDAWSAGA